MAKFKIALEITGLNEGGYVNNQSDKGGETVRGISRKFWPNWKGWIAVDKAKEISIIKGEINRMLNNSSVFSDLVTDFYKQNFWDVNKLDLINDQQLANNLYDSGVNEGVTTAAKYLQQACAVTEDGIIGKQTISAANSLNAKGLFNAINAMRLAHYEKLAEQPDQKQFLNDWEKRLIEYKQL